MRSRATGRLIWRDMTCQQGGARRPAAPPWICTSEGDFLIPGTYLRRPRCDDCTDEEPAAETKKREIEYRGSEGKAASGVRRAVCAKMQLSFLLSEGDEDDDDFGFR